MTSHYDDDAFELTFENAVADAHTRAERGNEPSGKTWETIRREISARQVRAETADPRALGPDLAVEQFTTERTHSMDAAFAPQYFPDTSAKSQRFGWIALMAAGLVGLMLITSLWTNGGSPGDDRNDLAWAPGMGTPESTPAIASACSAEPLTVDEVMETVMNPNNGYIRLGMSRVPVSESMWEPEDEYLLNRMPSDRIAKDGTNQSMFELADGDTASDLMNTGNDIWTCMTEGSAFQVWGLMDPILVQQVILDKFPVIRTESGLRSYIEETGPKLFRETSAKRFYALSQFSSAQTAEPLEVRVAEFMEFDETRQFARVDLATSEDGGFVFRLYLREVAPGVWTVYDLTPQPA